MPRGPPPTGPFLTTNCQLPADVTPGCQGHPVLHSTRARPARRWSSSRRSRVRRWSRSSSRSALGRRPREEGAALYDADVKKQAQQLGLPGWE